MLPTLPSPRAEIHELADFAELLCWENGLSSEREIVAALGRIDDNEFNIGCEDDESIMTDYLDDVMNEIGRRESNCKKGYPFKLGLNGTSLHYLKESEKDPKSIIYRYLLLCTRLNMQKDRLHKRIDGSVLLEELSAHVLKNYLGWNRAESLVCGTALGGSFKERIESICRNLREGGRFHNTFNISQNEKDGGLDVIAWIPFSDQLPGQLIIFAQCKTGTSWHDYLFDLQPDSFIKKWMEKSFLVNPLRAFCVAESANKKKWEGYCIDAGIFLDRCRLIDFSDNVNSTLIRKIESWTNAAWSFCKSRKKKRVM